MQKNDFLNNRIINSKMTKLICIKIKSLRKEGYSSLIEWKKKSNHIYIGRYNHYVEGADKSKWCNPYPLTLYNLETSLNKFKLYLFESGLIKDIEELEGKILGCWCELPNDEIKEDHCCYCHGQVLINYLNNYKKTRNIPKEKIEECICHIMTTFNLERNKIIQILRNQYWIVY